MKKHSMYYLSFSVILFGQEELYICNTKIRKVNFMFFEKDIINQSFTAYTNLD